MQFDPSAFVAAPELLLALTGLSSPVDCSVDHELFRQGGIPEGVFILHKGDAEMVLADHDGAVVATVSSLLPGSLLGLPASIMRLPYSMSCNVKEGAQVAFVDLEAFSALLTSEPSLALQVLRVMAMEVQSMRRSLARVIQSSS